MKIINTLNSISISTVLTNEEIKQAERYAPESLNLYKDKTPVFGICAATVGCVSRSGIEFDNVKPDGTMYVTLDAPGFGEKTEDARKALLKDTYGVILYNLKIVEDQVHAALGTVSGMVETVNDSIAIVE